GERFGDGETEAGALIALGELAFHLLERPAKLPQRVGRDADAAVGNRDEHVIAGAPAANSDATALGRELHRIGEEIERDLFERATISAQMQIGRDLGVDDEPLLL